MAPQTPNTLESMGNGTTPLGTSNPLTTHLTHSSPELANGRHSLDGFHRFQAPDPSASRSPCPALNCLANHGYLPRDGRNITIEDLVKALENPNTYWISSELAEVLAVGGLALLRKLPPISLHDLARHDRIEHDASLVHQNAAEGHEYAPIECDIRLLEGLLGGKERLSLDDVAERRVLAERVANSKLRLIHREIARGEWALVLDIFGRETSWEVSTDFLRVWLKENRFPKDWAPKHEQGLLDTRKVSLGIHEKMHEYRKTHEATGDNCEDKEKEQELALLLQETPDEAHMEQFRERESHSTSPRLIKRRKTDQDSLRY